MSLARRADPIHTTARAAQADIILWTTKDGRQIPLDEMSDDHIANAVRVLSLWRTRLKKHDPAHDMIKQLADAISRFKLIQRQRRRQAPKPQRQAQLKRQPSASDSPDAPRRQTMASRSSFGNRPRKPVANT